MEKTDSNSSIEIYRSPEGNIELNVKLENDTVWLTQSQMAELFGRDRTVISRHIRNCFNEGELDKSLVCAKFAHPKKYGRREGFEQTVEKEYYNLDVIISVGYRVKSINGTRFRQWANTILKQYLIKGYAINKQRLDNYSELKEVVRLMSRAITLQNKITEGEYNGLFNVISDYVYALDTLDRYDYQTLLISKTTKDIPNLWRRRIISIRRRESSRPPLSCCKKSLLQRWKQANSCHALPLVYGK